MSIGKNGTALSEARDFGDVIKAQLASIVEVAEKQLGRDQMRYERGAVTDLTGNATLEFATRPGVEWYIQRLAVHGSTSYSAYLNEISDLNRIDNAILDANGNAIRTPGDPGIYIPPRQKLIIQFLNAAPPIACAINMQIREVSVEGETTK